jgi:hypothetical protein
MTITSTQNRVSFDGNGAPGVPGVTAFSVPFRFLQDSDLVVLVRVDATGVDTTKTMNTDYQVTGEGGASGTVTFLIEDQEPQTGETLIIYGNPPMTQSVDYQSGDTFPAETHEQALDKLTLQQTRTRELVERTPGLVEGDTDGSGAYDANSNRIKSLGTPTATTDATTKTYVDALVNNTALGPAPTGLIATGSVTSRTLADRWGEVKNVKDFGAVGNGVADDTAEIQAAVDAVAAAGGGEVFFPTGTYIISNRVRFLNMSNFVARGAATVKMANGTTVAGGYANFLVQGCTNFVIEDLTLDGNRANRTPAEVWGHTILISGACTDAILRNVSVINGTTDGILIESDDNTDPARFCRNILIDNCTADNNYRQGLSIINAFNVMVRGGEYINTNGTAPQSGIDIESDAGSSVPSNEQIRIEGARFYNNVGWGILASGVGSPEDIVILGNHFEGNGSNVVTGGAISAASPCRILSNDCSDFKGSDTVDRGVIDIPATSEAYAIIHGNAFRDCTSGHSAIYVHGLSQQYRTVISSNDMENVVGGISTFCPGTRILNNRIETASGVGISSNATHTTVSGNYIKAATGRGIWSGYEHSRIVMNHVVDVASVASGYIVVVDQAGQTVEHNLCESAGASSDVAVYLGKPPASCRLNRSVNLVPTNDGSLTTGLITVFTDQDATPSVLNFEIFRANNTVATTITALDDGYVGQEILVLFTTSNTTVDFTGTTLKGNAGVNWPAASGDHMTCVFDGANWYCDVSDNTA